MPGIFKGNSGAQPAQPGGFNNFAIEAAPLFASLAAGYSSGRGPYAYMDQGIAGMQARAKEKRDAEIAAKASAAFAGLVPGGMGGATRSSMGGGGSNAPGGYYAGSGPKYEAYPLGVDALPQSPTTPGGYSMGTEVKSYIPEEVKNGIFAGESGGDYNALFGFSNRAGGKFENVKLTDMTVDQALAFADPSGDYGQTVKGQIGRVATPMGAYQIVGTTLKAAKEGLGLTGNERMTPELQDQLGGWIYANQGTGAWEGYRGPQAAPEGGWGGSSVTMSAKGEGAPSGYGMGGGPVDPMADPYVQQLMTVMSMPGLTPEQQSVVQLQLKSRMDMLSKPQPGAEEEQARAMRARDADLLGYQRGSPEWTQYVVTGEMPEGMTQDAFTDGAPAGTMWIDPRDRTAGVRDIPGYRGPADKDPLAALKARAKEGGLIEGTPEYRTFMINNGPANGMIIESTPEGGLRVVQGDAVAGAKPFTEGQSKDIVYATRAEGALSALDPIASALTSRGEVAADWLPMGLGGGLQSDDYQVAKTAGDEFLQAILRKDTGAAITAGEQSLYGETYLPRPGDSEARLKYKAEARQRAVAALKGGMSAAQIVAQEKALEKSMGGDTSAAVPNTGTTSSGVQWSVKP